MSDPSTRGAWEAAKRYTPSRPPFTDGELANLRERYMPLNLGPNHSAQDLVTIWTLLDMLEADRGWTVALEGSPDAHAD